MPGYSPGGLGARSIRAVGTRGPGHVHRELKTVPTLDTAQEGIAVAPIDNYQDILDVRDIIEEFEASEYDPTPEGAEYRAELRKLLSDLKGNGGDEQWEGDWYPLTLVRDSYFEDYAQELAEDVGYINGEETWPHNCIDWERAARELRMDYTSVEYDGVTYWYR